MNKLMHSCIGRKRKRNIEGIHYGAMKFNNTSLHEFNAEN